MSDPSIEPRPAQRNAYFRASKALPSIAQADSPDLNARTETSGGGIRRELLFISAALAACFVLFYHRWPIWEDQAIYHYMAWGLRHDLVPYRDTVNMNWPGSIGIHLLALGISGSDGFGLRLLDTLFLALLATSSYVILRAYHVSGPLRLLCVTCYITGYFLTDFRQTAQRESFALPLVAVGLACALVAPRRARPVNAWIALACGLLAGFGLAIKPTLVVPLAFAQALPVICQPKKRQGYRCFFWLTAGELAAAVVVVSFLAGFGDARGFWEWGVRYAFGPYAAVKWPIQGRLRHTLEWSLWAPPVVLALTGGVALLAAPFGRRQSVRGHGLTVLALLAMIMLATALAQGKTHCRYHFHPFFWALSLAGGSALQAAFRPAVCLASMRFSMALCLALFTTLGAEAMYRRQANLPDGAVLGANLQPYLSPTDEFVLFGFAPTFHARINRRTPFPYVDSWILLSCCASSDQERLQKCLGRSLADAVRQPKVKCVVLQRGERYAACGGMIAIESIENKYVPQQDLRALGYSLRTVRMSAGSVFEVWLRNGPPEDARATSATADERREGRATAPRLSALTPPVGDLRLPSANGPVELRPLR